MSKNKTITLSPVKDLLERLNNLDPTKKLDKDTIDMYNKIINNDLKSLISLIEKKGPTNARRKIFKTIAFMIEIFTGKKVKLSDHF